MLEGLRIRPPPSNNAFARGAEEVMKVKQLPSGAVDEPMTLWSASGGDAYGAMKEGPLPRQPRGTETRVHARQ